MSQSLNPLTGWASISTPHTHRQQACPRCKRWNNRGQDLLLCPPGPKGVGFLSTEAQRYATDCPPTGTRAWEPLAISCSSLLMPREKLLRQAWVNIESRTSKRLEGLGQIQKTGFGRIVQHSQRSNHAQASPFGFSPPARSSITSASARNASASVIASRSPGSSRLREGSSTTVT